jgi:hypothetical protein
VWAGAQTKAEAASADAAVQVGPFALSPRFFLRDIGVDSNPRNVADDPQRDFTFTTGPGLGTWMHVGRLWVTSESAIEWLYYNETAGQRAFNVKQDLLLELDLLRVVPHAGAGYDRSRRQLNFELDGRLEQTATYASVGVEFKPGARTSIDFQGERRSLSYGDEALDGVLLAGQLNRESQQAGVVVRYALTPLTTLVVDAAVQQDRFEFDDLRDSDAVRILPGLEFQPFALISGSARIGVKQFRTRDESVPDYTGLITSVDVAYTLRDRIRFTVRSTRDVEYSIEPLEPFYVSNGLDLEIVRVIGLDWDVVLSAGRTTLDYQAIGNGEVLGRTERTDEVRRYGVGLGRHVGEDIRVGFDVFHAERRSDLPARAYSGWRTGGSLTYGF